MKKKGIIGKIWGIIYPPLYYYAAQNIIYAIYFFIAFIITERYIASNNIVVSFSTVISICESSVDMSLIIIFAALVTLPWMIGAYAKDMYKEKISRYFVRYEKTSVPKYLYIVPLALVSMYAASWFTDILSQLLPSWYSAGYDTVEEALSSGGILLQILGTVIFAPLVEEFIFRAVVYNRVRRISNKIAGAVVSSLLFGILHMNFVQGVFAFILGLLMTFVYDRYKSIAAPVFYHMLVNGISVFISFMFADYADEVLEASAGIEIFELISEISMCIIAVIFTFGFVMLIKQKVVPEPVKKRITEGQEGATL